MRDIDQLFQSLGRSSFRARFRLNARDLAYYHRTGHDTILSHGRDFLSDRIVPARPHRDGKQTPMRGHPFFVGQHATATCCRVCLAKWHQIPLGRVLTAEETSYIVKVVGHWLRVVGHTPR